MLTIDNLSFYKDNKKIFSNLSFSLSISSALIITGKNGCGKSSLLKLIAGIYEIQSGRVLWGNENIENFRDDFNGDMQFIGHKNFLKPELTVKENLEFYADLFGTKNAVAPALEFFSLKDLQNSIILTPLCPRAGPTGGAGLACPPLICNFKIPEISLAILKSFLPVRILTLQVWAYQISKLKPLV